MKSKYTIVVIALFVVINDLVAQEEDSLFGKIREMGRAKVQPLKSGHIEGLKNIKPPEGTWVYSKLEYYKKQLANDTTTIIYGELIEESVVTKGIYSYNLYALKPGNKEPYYFVAVISVNTNTKPYKIETTYLFTEKDALKMWWRHVFGYYESSHSKKIPKEYLGHRPPPPPLIP